MVHVAIAGGTNSIGLYISRAILLSKKHTLVVLSRKNTHPELQSLGAEFVQVDYTDPSSLERALEGVHTIISAIGMLPIDTFVVSQLALLDAGKKVGVKRFAPSEWAMVSEDPEPIDGYKPKSVVARAVEASGIEYALFECGIFMNYFATGTAGIGHLQPLTFIVDVEKCEATLPGDGKAKVNFTSAEDVGRFVTASLDFEKWEPRLGMAGDTKSYNEVVEIAERIRGAKFKRSYKSVVEMQDAIVTNAPDVMTNFYTQVMLEVNRGRLNFPTNLNVLCPDIQPLTVEAFIKKWWA